MTVIDAPVRMGRRAEAERLLSGLPTDLQGAGVEVVFPIGAYPTTSFIDELVRAVLVDRGAKELRLTNASERLAEVARFSAADLGVVDRLQFN